MWGVAFPICFTTMRCCSSVCTLQRSCVTNSSSTRAFSHLSLRVLFITTITLAMNNDDYNWVIMWCTCSKLSALKMRSDWFFPVLITFWQMIHCSLQTKTNKKAMLWQGNCTFDAIVQFDMYRDLQRHYMVPLIAQLSCTPCCGFQYW